MREMMDLDCFLSEYPKNRAWLCEFSREDTREQEQGRETRERKRQRGRQRRRKYNGRNESRIRFLLWIGPFKR